jgi:2-dehydropantoate 2-reductase
MLRKLLTSPVDVFMTVASIGNQSLSLRSMASKCKPSDVLSTSSSIFPLHVIGAGSVGLLYASKIHHAYRCRHKYDRDTLQRPVTLLMRAHHKPHLIHIGTDQHHKKLLAPVTLRSGSERALCGIPVDIIGDNSPELSRIRTLLLCTKANDACAALTSIWDRLCSSLTDWQPRIIILSNGALAIKDAILKNFPSADVKIIYGSTTHGVYKDINDSDKYCIHHAGHGSTFCTAGEFAEVCEESGLNGIKMTPNEMKVMLWKKLAVNCVANPLTAIHNVRNGRLAGLQHNGQSIGTTMTRILEEVSDVAMKEIESDCIQSSEEDARESIETARVELSVPSLQSFVDEVLCSTSNNISSMLQDVRAKRITEVQFLNGHVCRVANGKYGIDCPYNASMCVEVEALLKDKG